MKQYLVIKGIDKEHLEKMVNLAINDGGFVPLGGVTVNEFTNATYFYQAMLKQPDTKD